MKKTILFVAACLGLSSLTGCGGAFAPSGAPLGAIAITSTAKSVSSNAVGAKKGEACALSILDIVTIGDATTATAARNGGIQQISIVDNSDLNILGIYQSHCAEVSGN